MIRIRVELVEREEQDLTLKISVQDTGVGLQLRILTSCLYPLL